MDKRIECVEMSQHGTVQSPQKNEEEERMMKYEIPAPGSPEAVKDGCTCPVMDNCRGAGYMIGEDMEPLFVVSSDCPVHGRMSQYVMWVDDADEID